MAGRKTKLNPKRQSAICEVMKHGGTYKAAAAAAGICESTLHDWRKYGDAEESGIYRRFVDALEQAIGEGEAAAVSSVYRAFTEPSIEVQTESLPDGTVKTKEITRPPDPSFALRWLERRNPQRWNVPTRLALSGDPDAEPITIFRLPDNGRDDATPAPDGSAPCRPVAREGALADTFPPPSP